MTIDDRTPGRAYLLPNASNLLEEDVQRMITSFGAIDADVTAILLALGLKAAAVHGHSIADVAGLQSALDDKLSVSGFSLELDNLADVNAPSPAGGQVLMRVASAWIPVTLQVNHVSGLEAALNALAGGYASRWDATVVAAAPNKTTPADTDVLALVDSVLKKITWANIKVALKAVNDTLYAAVGHAHSVATTSVAGFLSAADKSKLDNVAAGATANSSDATLVNRGNHTGTQDVNSTTSGVLAVSRGGTGQVTEAGMRGVYTGGDSGNLIFPVGTILLVCGAYPARNAVVSFGPQTSVDKYHTSFSGVAGTWRARGAAWSTDWFLAQRVA